jgi:hypothetical protein
MARTEAKKPAAERALKAAPEELPPVVPMRKRPWLLALAAICFTGWLAFLVAMALQP